MGYLRRFHARSADRSEIGRELCGVDCSRISHTSSAKSAGSEGSHLQETGRWYFDLGAFPSTSRLRSHHPVLPVQSDLISEESIRPHSAHRNHLMPYGQRAAGGAGKEMRHTNHHQYISRLERGARALLLQVVGHDTKCINFQGDLRQLFTRNHCDAAKHICSSIL